MNFIGIDISLNSTAVYIESSKGNNIISITNKKDNNIYIKELNRCGVIFHHEIREKSEDYSENEVLKLKHFIKITNNLLDDIISNIDLNDETFCMIEGYSFSRNTSSILDIVSLSTLIRSELFKRIENINIDIISPSSLKLEVCKMVYEPINVGKTKIKLKYANNEGISGGSFKKPQMYRSMIEGNIESPIYDMLVTYKDLMDRTNIPNPIEDIIDAIFACKVQKNKIIK